MGLLGTQFEIWAQNRALPWISGHIKMNDMRNAAQSPDEQYKTLGNDWEGVKKMELAAGPWGMRWPRLLVGSWTLLRR